MLLQLKEKNTVKRACLESTLLSNTKLLRLWFQKLLQNFSLLLSFWRVNTFSVLPLRLSLQQMDAGVWTVGSQRWVIVIAALRAEGCVPVMKCYDGEDRYLWPARIRVTAEQKLHFSAIAQKHSLHSFSSPIASLGLSLSLTDMQTHSLGSSRKHSHPQGHTSTLSPSLHTASSRGGVYPGLASGQPMDRWGAFLNLDAKEWAERERGGGSVGGARVD